MRVAGAEEVVEELGGLDGVVGDRGLTVSGGQRQRVSLARALVAHPRVLILDDALSAVNPSLEVEIMRRVRRYLPDTAILYITRRTSLDEIADRTMRLDPPEHVEPLPQVETGELFDGTAATAVTANAAESLFAGDAIDSIDTVEEIGMETEAEEGSGGISVAAGATAGLAAIDPVLAKLVHQLEVTQEELRIPDGLVDTDSRPRFRTIAKAFKGVAAVAVVLVLLLALLTIVPDLMFGRIVNIIQDSDGQDTSTAFLWAGLLVVVAIGVGFTSKYYRICANRFTQSVLVVLRRKVFYRLSRLGVNYYDRELPGDVATRVVADLDKILAFVQGAGFQLASLVAIFVVAMGAIIVIAPGVVPVLLVLFGLIIILTAIQLPLANRALNWSREELGVVTRKFQEDFGARHEIRHLGAHAIQTQKFVEASWERRRARWWAITLQNSHTAVVQFLGQLTTVFVLYTAGTMVLDQELSIGAAVTVQLLATVATRPLQAIGPLYNQFLDVRVSWRRLCEPFDEPIFPEPNAAAIVCPPLDGPVTFQSVDFTYPGTERPVLRGRVVRDGARPGHRARRLHRRGQVEHRQAADAGPTTPATAR